MKLLLPGFACLLAAAAALPVHALEWQTVRQTINATPLQRTAETTFAFTNTSRKTVTLRSVDTSCDCLEATPSAKSFAPGATGSIHAHFNIGDRVGTYERTIIVSTDEGGEPTALTAELRVPEVATLVPRSVDWSLNGPATPKVIEVVITPGSGITLHEVQATSTRFAFRLETVAAGKHYRLHLEPTGTDKVANAAFRLCGKAATGQDVVLSAYGNVR